MPYCVFQFAATDKQLSPLHTNGHINVVSMQPNVIPKRMQAADESIPWLV
jgi:hypothetical protein